VSRVLARATAAPVRRGRGRRAGSAELSLVTLVEAAGKELVVAGDAVAPRTAMHAFREGDGAGRAV